MFMVVALISLLTAGQPLGDPIAVNSKMTFAGEDKCNAYLQSDEFQQHKLALYSGIRRRLQSLQPSGFEAVELPEVVITASCMEDNRV